MRTRFHVARMKRIVIAVANVLAVACSPDIAQDAHPRPAQPSNGVVLAPQDREFLERAAEGNNGEIAMGRLAASRGLRPDVRAFGQRMVVDHTTMNARLAAIAAKRRIALPTALGEHQAGYDRLVDLQRETFDQEFLQVMNEDHDMAYQLFRSEAAGGVDPALKAYAEWALAAIESHLAHAKSAARGIAPTP
jgi:putative membrane protein